MCEKKMKKYRIAVVVILLFACILEGCGNKRKVIVPYLGSDATISTSCTIDILDSWTPFMTNPYLWCYDENPLFMFGIATEKFESLENFQNDFLKVVGPSWEIKESPNIFSIKDSQFDYIVYAEYGDDRIVDFLMLDDNGLVWYIEFNYVEDADNVDAIIEQAKKMIFSFDFSA